MHVKNILPLIIVDLKKENDIQLLNTEQLKTNEIPSLSTNSVRISVKNRTNSSVNTMTLNPINKTTNESNIKSQMDEEILRPVSHLHPKKKVQTKNFTSIEKPPNLISFGQNNAKSPEVINKLKKNIMVKYRSLLKIVKKNCLRVKTS